jgi:heptosyltransferase-2/heptosyltransferase-3
MNPWSRTAPLVVRFGRLGDMVLLDPLLRLLHGRYREPCALLTAGAWTGQLFSGRADIGRISQWRRRNAPFRLSPERWRTIAMLRRHRGPVYVCEDSVRQLRHIRRLLRLGGVAPDRCLFITEQASVGEHWVDRLLALGAMTPPAFRAGDFPVLEQESSPAPRLNIYPADRDDRDAWLRSRGLAGRPLILVQAGNKQAIKSVRADTVDSKAWPVERWAALLRHMKSVMPEAAVMLCGAPAEAGILDEIRGAASVPGVEIAAHDLPLRRLLAVMETAHSMVSVDTGPAHMASAVGCPLVVLYGTGSVREWGRRSPCGRPVIELGGPPERNAVNEIAVGEVIDAWSRLQGMIPA